MLTRRNFLKCGTAGGISILYSPEVFAAALQEGRKPKTLVLGGGAFALGYVLAHPDEALILERGIHLGADFALTGGPETAGHPHSDFARRLLDGLEGVGIAVNGKMELPPLADFLSSYYSTSGGKAFLSAELVDASRQNRGWRVRILGGGSEGVSSYAVARILDTTDYGWRCEGVDRVTGRRASLLTDKGYFHSEMHGAAGIRESRLKLYSDWEKSGRTDHVLAECNAIRTLYSSGRIERRNPSGFTWIPSAQFPDLITAFEEGARWSWR